MTGGGEPQSKRLDASATRSESTGSASIWSSRFGMDVEFEHGSRDPQTDVTGDDPIVTGKIALAHMKEFPDYYERLERMEADAERDWAAKES